MIVEGGGEAPMLTVERMGRARCLKTITFELRDENSAILGFPEDARHDPRTMSGPPKSTGSLGSSHSMLAEASCARAAHHNYLFLEPKSSGRRYNTQTNPQTRRHHIRLQNRRPHMRQPARLVGTKTPAPKCGFLRTRVPLRDRVPASAGDVPLRVGDQRPFSKRSTSRSCSACRQTRPRSALTAVTDLELSTVRHRPQRAVTCHVSAAG